MSHDHASAAQHDHDHGRDPAGHADRPSRPDVDRSQRLTEPPHTHPGQDEPHTHPAVSAPGRPADGPLRIGIGGPVGSGKTALVAALCRTLGTGTGTGTGTGEHAALELAVVTNDIYTTEDGDFLVRHGVLPAERITAVQTGACPHTAIRDDISMNLDAVEDLEDRFDPDVVLVESGGDNLTATFSYGLVDAQVFVIDVAGGDKVPRKGGPGVITSDLLVVNKTDLAPLVGADLGVMARDAGRLRHDAPVAFTSLREDPSAAPVAGWVRGLLAERRTRAGGARAAAPGAAPVPVARAD